MITTKMQRKYNNNSYQKWKHPCLVTLYGGNDIFLTIPFSEAEMKNYDMFERDAIVVCGTELGHRIYKLNLEECELFDGSVTIENEK